ncbi:MAG: hypothetical protein ACT6U0_13565 [Shinella sp.]|uniref:hypothetical protein n=1 Tax=Shinella sp. TaxID=1870904 RepID=UPI004035ECA1
MTSFVTREEYDRLTARLAALEAKDVVVNVTVSDAGLDEKIAELVRQSLAQGWREFERGRSSRLAGDFFNRG